MSAENLTSILTNHGPADKDRFNKWRKVSKVSNVTTDSGYTDKSEDSPGSTERADVITEMTDTSLNNDKTESARSAKKSTVAFSEPEPEEWYVDPSDRQTSERQMSVRETSVRETSDREAPSRLSVNQIAVRSVSPLNDDVDADAEGKTEEEATDV